MEIPSQVLKALDRLTVGGFSAYIVGGCVRDSLLGRRPLDWDLCSSALPQELMGLFSGEKLIETGIRHGTLTLILDGISMEITTFRLDGSYSDLRHPDSVSFTHKIEEDLSRRDFTVNAMAYHPLTGLVDPFKGRQDLENRILRTVGPPKLRFGEDALRILRALRFSAVLGFRIEEETKKAMEAMAEGLNKTAAERQCGELKKLLTAANAYSAILENKALFLSLLPELKPMDGCSQNNPYHCMDVLNHSLTAFKLCGGGLIPKLAALLHDMGKPLCKTTDAGGTEHFYGHTELSAALAERLMLRLRFDRSSIDEVCSLIRRHSQTLPISEKRLKRLLAAMGPRPLEDLFSLIAADIGAQSPAYSGERLGLLQEARESCRNILAKNACLCRKDLAVNGSDLIAMGMKPSKEIGLILGQLLNEVLDDKLENRKDILIHRAAELIVACNN